MTENSYQYKPLDRSSQEIRLIHLLPGQSEDDIKIRIVHAPFFVPAKRQPQQSPIPVDSLRNLASHPWTIEETEDGGLIIFNVATGEAHPLSDTPPPKQEAVQHEPQYEALSYVWGPGAISHHVEIVSQDRQAEGEPSQILGIRQSLDVALRNLRHVKDTRVLWIDAICINQQDIAERNEQVKRMTNIYTLARGVVAWLGDDSDDSKNALDTLQHVGSQLSVTKGGRVIAAPGATEPRLWRNDHAPSFKQRTWQALAALVERPWFYRIWCWQEISLGGRYATLQCGSSTITWKDFWLAILCLHNKDISHSVDFRERCRHIVFLKHDAADQSMSNILDISRSKGCVDPRDKIYGLLGIAPTYFISNIVVDYLRPVEDIYREAFLTHVNATKRLELLKHCDLSTRAIGGPSWVPDWSKTEFAAPILSEQLSTGTSRAWFTYHDLGVLEVAGIHYTTIKSVSAVASRIQSETLLVVKEWFQDILPGETYVTGESMQAAFALTLCMNRTKERHPYIHFKSVSEWVRAMKQMLCLDSTSANDPIYSDRETANTIQKIRGRRYFTTESGHMGTAPAGVQVGDCVCLLLGTYSPMVLRQSPSGYTVVGECYVHGLADSVGILGPPPSPWRTIIKGDARGRPTQWFLNGMTGIESIDDPRLGSLPPGWERAMYERTAEDPAIFERFRNTLSGELVNYDPRLTPEMLETQGVEVQFFRLV